MNGLKIVSSFRCVILLNQQELLFYFLQKLIFLTFAIRCYSELFQQVIVVNGGYSSVG